MLDRILDIMKRNLVVKEENFKSFIEELKELESELDKIMEEYKKEEENY